MPNNLEDDIGKPPKDNAAIVYNILCQQGGNFNSSKDNHVHNKDSWWG